MVVYAVLFCAIRFGRPMPEGALRTTILGMPMMNFGLAIWAIARHVARIGAKPDSTRAHFLLRDCA